MLAQSQVDGTNWNRPAAPVRLFVASGSPFDSHWMTRRASSTRAGGKYCSTRGRHSSTSRAPPSTGGWVVVVGAWVWVVVVGAWVWVVVVGAWVWVVVARSGLVVVVVVVVAVVVVGGGSVTSGAVLSSGTGSGRSSPANTAAATRPVAVSGSATSGSGINAWVGPPRAANAAKPSAAAMAVINIPAYASRTRRRTGGLRLSPQGGHL